MINRSRKIKSAKLQRLVRSKILKTFSPNLRKKDVDTAKEGQSGPDIILSRNGKKLCPYQFEIKNQNRMRTMWKWYKQAAKNTKLNPVVVAKCNSRDPLVIISIDHFFNLIR
jgi:hypothetical protein|tara:strand:- start:136 stop:471 length:336 start_codon:yes stop_codon:yes gene_type:complete